MLHTDDGNICAHTLSDEKHISVPIPTTPATPTTSPRASTAAINSNSNLVPDSSLKNPNSPSSTNGGDSSVDVDGQDAMHVFKYLLLMVIIYTC